MPGQTIDLEQNAQGVFDIPQLTLPEEAYCQLRAQGETRRTSWKQAFGTEDVCDKTLDSRVSRLEKRFEIERRIREIRREIAEANALKWAKRREELMEVLYHGALRVARDPEQGGIPAAVKAISQLSNMLGWNEPQRLEIDAGPTTGNGLDAKEVSHKLDKLLELTTKAEGTNT